MHKYAREKDVRLKALVDPSHSKRSRSGRIGDSNYSISPFILWYMLTWVDVWRYIGENAPERSIWNRIHL